MIEGMRPTRHERAVDRPGRGAHRDAGQERQHQAAAASAPPRPRPRRTGPSIEPDEMSISPAQHHLVDRQRDHAEHGHRSDDRLEVADGCKKRSLASEKATKSTSEEDAERAPRGAGGTCGAHAPRAAPRSAPRLTHRRSAPPWLTPFALLDAGGRGHDALLGGLVAPELAGHAALAHDQDAVGHGEDLLELRGDEQDGLPLPAPGRP